MKKNKNIKEGEEEEGAEEEAEHGITKFECSRDGDF